MDSWAFWAPLRDFAAAGNPIFGTCAGMILLAKGVSNPPQKSLGLIDIDVERNSYGRQVNSFEGTGVWAADEQPRSLPMIFIRAPRIARLGDGVAALATCGDDVVVARQGQMLVASFSSRTDQRFEHPSLFRRYGWALGRRAAEIRIGLCYQHLKGTVHDRRHPRTHLGNVREISPSDPRPPTGPPSRTNPPPPTS
ncbi:Pyridoxal 5'-phosphate synthase subunit PdxT [Geodia barretti]|uniref:Pyridoxal 5'-phosphate synthase subunit PdxT n=1 Tax=Geodia barretti TaxID=519541 RepID=A0AA35XCG0_GEOBA|nr:Pyridoxal 5'-phosphate synthase subunit PdxT [Geodia barretti]